MNTTKTISHIWQRIEMWLSTHAPVAWKLLRPGVDPLELQQAETLLSITLPEDFKASYLLHDGGYVIDLVTEMSILPLESIIDEWQMYKELDEVGTWDDAEIPYYFRPENSDWETGPIQPVWWHQNWLPIGRDRAGNSTCLDLAPAPGGTIGQIIDRDHEVGPSRVLFSSFQEMLHSFASDLENGHYVDTEEGLSCASKH